MIKLLKQGRYFLILILLIEIIFGGLVAQPLRSKIKRVSDYLELGELYLSRSQIDSSNVFGGQACTLSRSISYEIGMIQAHLLLAKGFNYDYKYAEALEHLEKADSISRKLQEEQLTSEIALELGNSYYYLQEFETSLEYYQEAYRISEEKHPSKAFAALTGQANILNNISTHQDAIPVLQSALELAKQLEDYEKQVEVLNQIATIYYSVGELDSADIYFEELLPIKRDMGETQSLISDLTQYGDMFLRRGVYDRAQGFLFEALGYAEELNDSLLMVSIVTNIGESFIMQENWSKALDYAKLGVQMSELQETNQMSAVNWKNVGIAKQNLGESEDAISAYQSALDIYQNEVLGQMEVLKLQMLLAELLEQKTDYKDALYYLNRVLQVRTRYSDKLSMLDIQLTIAGIYLKLNNNLKAIEVLKNSEEISRQLKSNSGLSDTYYNMALAYSQLRDYNRAFEFQQLYGSYRDSVFNEEREKITQELERKFLKESEIRKNAELEAEVANKQLEIEKSRSIILEKTQQNYMLNGGIGLLSLLVVFLGYSYVKRKQLLQQKLITLEKGHEADNLRAFIGGEQKERQRIARELHDGLGARLASIKLIFNAVENDLPDVSQNAYFSQADHMLNHACHEVREISHNMMPGILDQYGLEQAVRDLCDVINRSQDIEMVFLSYGLEEPLEDQVNISVFRIVQELTSNIVKHSKATEGIVQITLEDEILGLTVEDNGIGFEKEKLQGDGIGLKNIKSRVVFLQGTIEVDALPGDGCTIYIEIPVKERK